LAQELVLVQAQELVPGLGPELVPVEAQHKHQAKPLARVPLLMA